MYLLKTPDAPNSDDVRALIAQLEKTIAEEQTNKLSPPQGTVPAVVEAAPPALVFAAPPPQKLPLYKRWWLWTAVGAVVVVAVAVGVGVGVSLSGSTPTAQSALGTFRF